MTAAAQLRSARRRRHPRQSDQAVSGASPCRDGPAGHLGGVTEKSRRRVEQPLCQAASNTDRQTDGHADTRRRRHACPDARRAALVPPRGSPVSGRPAGWPDRATAEPAHYNARRPAGGPRPGRRCFRRPRRRSPARPGARSPTTPARRRRLAVGGYTATAVVAAPTGAATTPGRWRPARRGVDSAGLAGTGA
jgi:hypothetical protein